MVSAFPALPSSEDASIGSFERQTHDVLTQFRDALTHAFSFVLPSGVQKSQDIQKHFDQSFNLSWKIYRIMREDSILEIRPHIPAAKPMIKLLEAMEKKGVPGEAVLRVREAFEKFEQHVATSSGDRAGFDAMTARSSLGENAEQIEMMHRRALFNSHRYVMGIEQDMFVGALVLHPAGSAPHGIDTLFFRMNINLRRLRSDIPVVVDTMFVQEEMRPELPQIRGLEEASPSLNKLHILPAFCSRSDLPLKQTIQPDGTCVTRWTAEGVGKSNGIDLAFGTLTTGLELKGDPRGPANVMIMSGEYVPTKKFVHDIIVHRSLEPVEFVESRFGYVRNVPKGIMNLKNSEIPQLPTFDRMAPVGDIHTAGLAEAPRYGPMLKHYCLQRGWNPNEMRVYRLRTEYPILNVIQQIDTIFPSITVAETTASPMQGAASV